MFSKKIPLIIIIILILVSIPLILFFDKKFNRKSEETKSQKNSADLVSHKDFEANLLSIKSSIKLNKDYENAPLTLVDTASIPLIYSNYSQQDYDNIQVTFHIEPGLPHKIDFDHHDPTTFIPREDLGPNDTKFYLGTLKKGELRETGFTFRAGEKGVVTIYASILIENNIEIKTNKITLNITE